MPCEVADIEGRIGVPEEPPSSLLLRHGGPSRPNSENLAVSTNRYLPGLLFIALWNLTASARVLKVTPEQLAEWGKFGSARSNSCSVMCSARILGYMSL